MTKPKPQAERPKVVSLYRYPVKGLAPERLDRATLAAGATMPFDRAWAIENGASRFDPEKPRYLPKIAFLMLMRDERLATLTTRFEDATQTLTILRGGKQVARGQLTLAAGRQIIEQFVAAYMKHSLRGAPKLVTAPDHSFSDVSAKCLHIVNLASVRELSRMIAKPLNPLRFRANVYVDGAPPFSELDWVGRNVQLGTVDVKPFDRTARCAATDVDPETGNRDMALPAALQRAFGHSDFGIYAKVVQGGEIIGEAPGDGA